MSDNRYPMYNQRPYSGYSPYGGGYGAYGYGYGYPMANQATQAALTGAMMGAMVGAARAAHHEGTAGERASAMTQAVLRDAARFGIATGLGAAVASAIPGGAIVKGASMIAVGAMVFSAQEKFFAEASADEDSSTEG